VRVISGVGYEDHTVSAFELHLWPVADPSDESACSVLREKLAAASAGDKGGDLFRDAAWARPAALRAVSSNVSVSPAGRIHVEPAARHAQAPPPPSTLQPTAESPRPAPLTHRAVAAVARCTANAP
jgi:hypothetical protein